MTAVVNILAAQAKAGIADIQFGGVVVYSLGNGIDLGVGECIAETDHIGAAAYECLITDGMPTVVHPHPIVVEVATDSGSAVTQFLDGIDVQRPRLRVFSLACLGGHAVEGIE